MWRCAFPLFAALFIIPITAFGGQPLSPTEQDTLFHRQVLFRWQQLSNTVVYQLQIAIEGTPNPFVDSLVVDMLDSTTATVVTEGLQWGKNYLWRVRGFDSAGRPGSWQETHHFGTRFLPEDAGRLTATIYDSSAICPGLTLFDNWETAGGVPHSYCVNRFGDIIWFAPPPTRWDQELLNSGYMLSLEGETLRERIRIATLDNETVWISPDSGYHHDVELLPNGDFLVLKRDERYIEVWGENVLWRGDDIEEIDSSGHVVWNWNSFDNLSLEDIDSVRLAAVFPSGLYDWTHGNACTYDPIQNTIYYSARNLSRITKIDKATGEKVWSMGHLMPSGEADFGDSLFWYQHAPEPQENGNLLLYNNNDPDLPHTHSSVIEIGFDFNLPEPAFIVDEFEQEDHSMVMGDADRLANGNTLVSAGSQGYLYELSRMTDVVWRLDTDLTNIYRAERIPSLFPQVFSVITPDQNMVLPSGSGSVRYTLYNEGTVTDTFRINFYDSNGWFPSVLNNVVVEYGERAILEFAYAVIPPADTTVLYLSVQSGLNPAVIDTSSVVVLGNEEIYQGFPDNYPSGKTRAAVKTADRQLTARLSPATALLFVHFELETPQCVTLTINDVLGRKAATLVDGYLSAGGHDLHENLSGAASGVYFVRLITPNKALTRRVVLTK